MKSGDILASKYRLVQRIGEGAMGEVWAGENLSTGRKVALKLILRSTSKQSALELRQRLLREARACGKLSHRNIVQIYDVSETPEGDPFLVLELLRGRTLGERLKDTRRIEPSMAARIGADIASALSVAHAAKIIHRDLKPANIFLHSDDGDSDDRFEVKVLDFGVCKDIGGNADGPATITNVAVGSPVYMSPEQVAMFKDLDGRTDIWSLGVVLYEMLTGGRPFAGSVDDVVRQIILTRINKVPAPSIKVRDISPDFDALVARCLENDRGRRIADARELANALTAIANVGAPLRPSGSGSRPGLFDGNSAGTQTTVPTSFPTADPSLNALSRQAAVHGPTGTALISAKQLVASPAPAWRQEMEQWRAQREATATHAASMEALHGGTLAIDSAAVIDSIAKREPTGTTSALGALSQPDFAPKFDDVSVGAATERRRNSQMVFVLLSTGVLSLFALVMLMLHAALVETEPEPRSLAAPRDVNSGMPSATATPPQLVHNDGAEVKQVENPVPSASAMPAPSARAPMKAAYSSKPKVPAPPPVITCTKSGSTKTCTKTNSKRLFGYFTPNPY